MTQMLSGTGRNNGHFTVVVKLKNCMSAAAKLKKFETLIWPWFKSVGYQPGKPIKKLVNTLLFWKFNVSFQFFEILSMYVHVILSHSPCWSGPPQNQSISLLPGCDSMDSAASLHQTNVGKCTGFPKRSGASAK